MRERDCIFSKPNIEKSFKTAMISTRHQTGLQVPSIIGSSVRNFLGPSKSVKFLIDEDGIESVGFNSTRRLLQLLNIKHPIGEMVASAVQTHHSNYGCYSTTMVVILGHWCEQFRSLLTKGYQVNSVLAVGDALLDTCFGAIQQSSVSLDQLEEHQKRDLRLAQSTCKEKDITEDQQPIFTDCIRVHSSVETKEVREPHMVAFDSKANVKSCSEKQTFKSDGSSIKQLEIPKEEDSGKWATYQEIFDDQDVSWFFTDEVEILPVKLLSISPDKPSIKPVDWEIKMIDDERNHSNDMCKYKLRKPELEKDSKVPSCAIPHFGLETVEGQGSLTIYDKENSNDSHQKQCKTERSRDFEFDNIFDSCLTICNDQKSYTTKKCCSSFDNQPNSKFKHKESFNSVQSNAPKIISVEEDDEFADCFENLPNLPQDKHLIEKDNNFIFSESIKSKEYFSLDQIVQRSGSSIDNLESKIMQKIQESSKLSRANCMKHSRHFTTINDSQIEQETNVLSEEPQSCRKGLPHENLHKIKFFSTEDLKPKMTNTQTRLSKILQGSRHFQEADLEYEERVEKKKSSRSIDFGSISQIHSTTVYESVTKLTEDKIDLLGQALSYGSRQAMMVAVELCKDQTKVEFCRLHTNNMNVYQVLGPSSSESRVEHGVILPITSEQVSLVAQIKLKKPRIMLVSGDVAYNYHHLGYKESIKADVVVENTLAQKNSEKNWKEKVLDTLHHLNINIMVVKGTVDSSVGVDCFAANILVVQRAKYSAMKAVSIAAEANIITYFLDADEDDIGAVSSVKSLNGGWSNTNRRSSSTYKQIHLISIQTPHTLKTALLCAPTQLMLDQLEDQLASCISRLTQAITEDRVIPGAGYPETIAIKKLNEAQVHESTDSVYAHDVAKALEAGLESYLLQLVCNCKEINDWSEGMNHVSQAVHTHASPCGCDIHSIVDCVSAKIAAWKTAWRLLKIILRTDSHITTGLDNSVF